MSVDTEKDNKLTVVTSCKSIQGEVLDIHLGEDLAAKYIVDGLEIDEATDRKLRWKADLYICSFMCIVYAIQFMDKTSTSAASIMGLLTDLGMKGKMYSWVGSSFYLGYLVFEFPMSFLLQRFPLAKTTGIIIVAWGAVMACSGASQSYAGFITTRTLLGALEGAITPSFIIITSQWYKRNEQFTRTLFWFGFNGVGSIVGSAIAVGLYDNHHLSLAGWRALMVIMGMMTVALGIGFFFHMPDNPSEAWFLSPEERALQVERIRDNKQGYGSKKIKWHQVREAFVDVRTWLYFAFPFVSNVPNGGLTNFSSILLRGMGFSVRTTLLYGMVGGAVEIGGCSIVGVLAMYFWNKFRMGWALIGAAMSVVCMCLLAWAPSNEGKMAGLFMSSFFMPLSYIGMISSISSNTAGRTKKSIASAMLLIGYCVGNLVGPQTFKPSEMPIYQSAKIAMAVCSSIAMGLQVALLVINFLANKKRDREGKTLPPEIQNAEFADLTDFENPEFRYEL